MGTVSTILHYTMDITIINDDNKPEVYRCDPSDTLLSLQQQIEENEGIDPEFQKIYFMGYRISEPSILLGDFLKDKDELTLCIPTSAIRSNFQNNTQSEVKVVNGSKDNFKVHVVPKRKKIPIKLTSANFGIVYQTEGTVHGQRLYQVLRYNVENFDEIELKTVEGEVQVVLGGKQIEPIDSTPFDERRSRSRMEAVQDCSKIAANIGKFLKGIAAIVYPGVNLALSVGVDAPEGGVDEA